MFIQWWTIQPERDFKSRDVLVMFFFPLDPNPVPLILSKSWWWEQINIYFNNFVHFSAYNRAAQLYRATVKSPTLQPRQISLHTLRQLWLVQHAAARVLTKAKKTSIGLMNWLKLLLLVYKCFNVLGAEYISDCLLPYEPSHIIWSKMEK